MQCLYSTFIALGLLFALAPSTFADDDVAEECTNERYEDFMELQYKKDKLEQERQRYADEIKEVRAAHKKAIAEARKTYERPKKADDSAGEAAYQAELKAQKEEREMIRRRYVDARDRKRGTKCHALQIPELKEYDLENY